MATRQKIHAVSSRNGDEYMNGKSRLYVPLGVKELVIASFKTSESNSILYRRYKTIEGLHKGITEAIQTGADYISLRIIKEKEEMNKTP